MLPMASLERAVRFLSKLFDRISQAGVFAMMLLIVGNIMLRKVWKPIYGTYDYVSFLGTVVVAFTLANCAVEKGHTQVDLLVARFRPRVQGLIDSIMNILSLGMFSLVTWQCIVLGNNVKKAGEVSMTSLDPFYPYIYAIAVGCGLLCLVILTDIINSLFKAVKR
jgi:TRAP-type C4-dicarboxylate transport system permease small subunit